MIPRQDQGVWMVAGAAAAAVIIPVALLWPGRLDVPEPDPILVPPLPSLELSLTGLAEVQPPFSVRRTPPDLPSADAVPQAEAIPPSPPPRLVGIVFGKGRSVALLKPEKGDTQTVRAGGEIDGWLLVSIARDQVTMELAGKRSVVRLDYSNKRPSVAQSTPIDSGSVQQPTEGDRP